jgi:hypothetical protein
MTYHICIFDSVRHSSPAEAIHCGAFAEDPNTQLVELRVDCCETLERLVEFTTQGMKAFWRETDTPRYYERRLGDYYQVNIDVKAILLRRIEELRPEDLSRDRELRIIDDVIDDVVAIIAEVL